MAVSDGVAAFTGLGGSFPVDWVATFTGIRTPLNIFLKLETLMNWSIVHDQYSLSLKWWDKMINTGHNDRTGYAAFKYNWSKRAFSINKT